MMKKNRIITIGREFCSGGGDIGRLVAEYFEIPCYDKKILDETAEALQINSELVKKYDERNSSLWESIPGYQYGYSWYSGDPTLMQPMNIRVADAQFNAIRRYAEAGSCVIIGRCADYVLKDRTDVLNVFIRAEFELRMNRAMRLYQISAADAKKLIKRTDKIRANYYAAHTELEWGGSGSYHLIVDSGKVGVDGSAQLVIDAAKYLDEHEPTVL